MCIAFTTSEIIQNYSYIGDYDMVTNYNDKDIICDFWTYIWDHYIPPFDFVLEFLGQTEYIFDLPIFYHYNLDKIMDPDILCDMNRPINIEEIMLNSIYKIRQFIKKYHDN